MNFGVSPRAKSAPIIVLRSVFQSAREINLYQSQSAEPSPITKSQICDFVVRKRENLYQSARDKAVIIAKRDICINHRAQKSLSGVHKRENLYQSAREKSASIAKRETCTNFQAPNVRFFHCAKAGEYAPINARETCASRLAQNLTNQQAPNTRFRCTQTGKPGPITAR